MVKIINNFII